MTEITVNEQSVEVAVTDQQIDINVNTSQIDINSTEQVVTVQANTGLIITQDVVNLVTLVRNRTGATIGAGKVVYINGATGNRPTIALASALTESTSSKTFGITKTAISNNSTGFVVTVGELQNIDTQSLTEGNLLWLGNTAGSIVTTPPAEPSHSVFLGYCVRSHPTQGVIEVRIANGYELDELHDVSALNPSNGDVLQYVSSTGLWTKTSSINFGTW
jgi:hypothetical protein